MNTQLPKVVSKFLILLLAAAVVLAACGKGEDKEQATQKSVTVGVMTATPGQPFSGGFTAGMTKRGYIEGENIRYITHVVDDTGQLESIAKSLVDAKVDLILAIGRPHVLAAQQAAGGTIPVLFGICGDPVQAGLVDSMEKPGRHTSGVTCSLGGSASDEKRLELLLGADPTVQRVFIPYNPDDLVMVELYNGVTQAAADMDVELVSQEIRTAEEYAEVLANFPPDIDAYFELSSNPLFAPHVADIVAVCLEQQIVLSTALLSITQVGGFMSYGPEFSLVGEQISRMADQVLQGTDAGTLPVESGELLLAVNLQTAATIGVEVPDDLLEQADIIVRGNEGQ
jgi:putative ABC transport system substrate-binding protein